MPLDQWVFNTEVLLLYYSSSSGVACDTCYSSPPVCTLDPAPPAPPAAAAERLSHSTCRPAAVAAARLRGRGGALRPAAAPPPPRLATAPPPWPALADRLAADCCGVGRGTRSASLRRGRIGPPTESQSVEKRWAGRSYDSSRRPTVRAACTGGAAPYTHRPRRPRDGPKYKTQIRTVHILRLLFRFETSRLFAKAAVWAATPSASWRPEAPAVPRAPPGRRTCTTRRTRTICRAHTSRVPAVDACAAV